MSLSSFAIKINSIRQIIPAYYLPPIFFLGIIGNILNIITFSRSRLRTNINSWYFICLSISQIGLLISNGLFRIISVGWSYGYDLGGTILSICKLRAYMFVLFLVLSRHFLCLIIVDRWMKTSESVWLRQKSTPKYAKWLILLGFIFWILFSCHVLIAFQIISNTCTLPAGSTYQLFYTIYNATTGILPLLIMFTFCFLLLKLIRKRRRNIGQAPVTMFAVVNQIIQQKTRTDFQFVRLSLIQSLFYLIFNSIPSGYLIYTFMTNTVEKSIEQRAIDNLVSDIGLYLLHTYASLTFIFYTLASSIFRKELKKYMLTIKNRLFQIFEH